MCGITYFIQNTGNEWSFNRASRQSNFFRFEARQGDFVPPQYDRIRSEVQADLKMPVKDVEFWVSDWINVSSNNGIQSDNLIIGQLHQTEDFGDFSGYPPFEFNLLPDGLSVWTAFNANPSGGSSYPHTERLHGYPFPFNTWIRRVCRFVFSWEGNAELQIWIDGVEALSLSGFSMGMNDSVGPYWKMGLYWIPETAQQVVTAKYANVEIRTGVDALRNRIENPMPLPSSLDN